MKLIKTPIALAVMIAVTGLTGCATSSDSDSMASESMQSELDEQRRKMAVLEQRLSTKDREITTLATEKAEMSRRTIELEERATSSMSSSSMSSSSTTSMSGTGELFPPNAIPGHCYTRIFIPPTFKTETEKVLVAEGGERLEIIPGETGYETQKVLVKEASTIIKTIPGTYRMVEERILVKEASTSLRPIPATYKYVEERIMVSPGTERLVVIPAKYTTVTEKILVKAAHTSWKKGSGPISLGGSNATGGGNGTIARIDDSTGEIMCLVEVPAVYRTITKRVQAEPASTRSITTPPAYKTIKRRVVDQQASTSPIEIPAVYKIVKRRIVDQPPTTRSIEIPAVYKTIKIKTIIRPPSTRTISTPPKYSTVTRRVPVTEGVMDWREILCKTNTSHRMVTDMQSALKNEGFYKGPIDGVIGRGTMQAIKSYQRSKGQPVGQLTLGTLKSLGVM